MNILLNYLIIGVVRRLFIQIIFKPEYVKLGYDEFDMITSGRVDSRNQNIAEFVLYSWKSVLVNIIAWPACVILDIGITIYYLYRLFKKD